MKIEPVERGPRLCDGGFKRAQVTKSCRAAGTLDDRSASARSLSACAGGSSKASFMLGTVAPGTPSNKRLQPTAAGAIMSRRG
jgi:hypothetical protein